MTVSQQRPELTRRELRSHREPAHARRRRVPRPAAETTRAALPGFAAPVVANDRRAGMLGRLRGRLLPLGSLLFAGILAVSTSVPAAALLVVPSGESPSSATSGGQSIEVSDAAALAGADRVTFDAASAAEARARQRAAALGAGEFTPTDGSIRWPFPFTSSISDRFGFRPAPCSGCSTAHKGLDFTPGAGAPISSIASGVVNSVVISDGGLGNHVIIDHVVDGQRVQSVYAHMAPGSIDLQAGDTVEVGQFVGAVGTTGASTGPHLHFELHVEGVAVDPFAWLTAHATND